MELIWAKGIKFIKLNCSFSFVAMMIVHRQVPITYFNPFIPTGHGPGNQSLSLLCGCLIKQKPILKPHDKRPRLPFGSIRAKVLTCCSS